jgi:hypothetical protein
MTTREDVPKLRTPGVIARELGEPLHRVLYVLQTRTFIAPSARAGRLRLYDLQSVALIRHALNAMDAHKGTSHD